MKRRKTVLGVLLSAALLAQAFAAGTPAQAADAQPPAAYGALPSAEQMQYAADGLSAFAHFSINTFTGKEWGDGTEDPDLFYPTDFDAEQWVKNLKDAGFQRLIMIAKHHDGFCTWDSAQTAHDVGSSTRWRAAQQAKGEPYDVMELVSRACTKYDMDMGVYLSPWDRNAPQYGTGSYNDYYKAQLRELLGNPKYGNNGKISEVWMDGAKGDDVQQEYDFQGYFDLIEQLQPGCVVFSPFGSSVRWIGNEEGKAGDPCWSKSNQQRQRDYYTAHTGEEAAYLNAGDPDGDIWSVGECDVSLTSGWYYHENYPPKSMDALKDIYFQSVGRGQVMLLNIAPDKTGQYGAAEAQRLQEFGQAVRDSFDEDLTDAAGVTASASAVRANGAAAYQAQKAVDSDADTYWTMDDGQTTGSLVIDLGQPQSFDVVSIAEYIKLGQRIAQFKVETSLDGQTWTDFGGGCTVGARRLVLGKPTLASKVRVTIEDAKAVPLIQDVGVYKAAEAFEEPSAVLPGTAYLDSADFTQGSGWQQIQDASYIGGTALQGNAGSSLEYTFDGSKTWLYGVPGGQIDVSIDGGAPAQVDLAGEGQKGQVLYASPDLAQGKHTVTVRVKSGQVTLEGASYLPAGTSLFELGQAACPVDEGKQVQAEIRRVGSTEKEAQVRVETAPGTAVHGRHYLDKSELITFAPGQRTATVTVDTVENEESTGNLDFYIQLSSPVGGALGAQSRMTVTIRDNEKNDSAALEAARAKQEFAYKNRTWQPFAKALAAAEAACGQGSSAAEAEKDAAITALQAAQEKLRARGRYTVADPFLMPAAPEQGRQLEAEMFTLLPNGGSDYVRLEDHETMSNGKCVGWFEPGNKIELPFVAAKAGTYVFTMSYFSGRPLDGSNNNTMNWSGTNVEAGSMTVKPTGYPANQTPGTAEIAVKVTKPGPGKLVFAADNHACPNIDQFQVSMQA